MNPAVASRPKLKMHTPHIKRMLQLRFPLPILRSAILHDFSLINPNNPEAFNPVSSNQEQIASMPNDQEQTNLGPIDLLPGSSEQINRLPANSEQSLQQPMAVSQDNSLVNGEQAALGIMQSVMSRLNGVGESFASSDSDSDSASANSSADSSDSEQTAQNDDSQTTVSDEQWPPAWMLKYAVNS